MNPLSPQQIKLLKELFRKKISGVQWVIDNKEITESRKDWLANRRLEWIEIYKAVLGEDFTEADKK